MEPHARYTVVGASVLIVLGIVVAALAWLLTTGNGRQTRHYTSTFTRQSLEGLEPDSDVHMRGIRVGSVVRFAFSKQQPGGVDVTIDVDASAPVRTSTRAVVDRNLITGLATIRLVTLQEDSPLLDRAHATIPEGESQLQQFSQTMSQLAQRADETMKRIGQALSPENQAAFAETLDNLRVATRSAGALTRRMDATLASIGRTADTLQSTTTSAASDFHRLADRYDTLGAQAGAHLGEATAAVRQLSGDVSRLAGRTEDFLGDAGIELRITSQQLRSAADALGTTSRKLGDPRAALLGPSAASLGPGETGR
ncbi:MlaD family protein [Piscinibacter sp. XHJ-5]|uniref:MlaD family protein n=1 Tax=Piscinibacter sp. XHJ-5 TaxID=3037797 RepID=UPI002452A4F0|nr:MlaD family protein [Piscinibacter sp. XHJ-5]